MRKSLSWLHIALAILAFILSSPGVKGQEPNVHIIPYRLVPTYDGCLLDVEFVSPVTFHNMEDIQRNETTEIFRERIAYELAVPFEKNTLFEVDGKHYYMLQVPYDGSFWNFKK